jgi:hypothetical protein
VFGVNRTLVPANPEANSIICAIKNGLSVVSNGPFLRLQAIQGSTIHETGSRISGTTILNIISLSTKEFGSIQFVRIYSGIIGTQKEKVLTEWKFTDDTYNTELTFNIEPTAYSYVRAEVYTNKTDSGMVFAATNPIWMEI